MALHHYLSQDRLRALAESRDLPVRTTGTALFCDICGFTALTESLTRHHGESAGVEALTQTVGRVYDAVITAVEQHGGSVVAFAGDAMTCWFDAADDGATAAAASALHAALAMQATMHDAAPLALKVSVASGAARRFTAGDPAIQILDVLAGDTIARVARADALAHPGDILLDAATADQVDVQVIERRTDAAGDRFAVVDPAWHVPARAAAAVPAAPPAALPPPQQLRPWVLPFVYEREVAGHGVFVTDLRPVVALFVRFRGLSDAFDEATRQRLDHWIRAAQRILQDHGGVLLELTMGDKGSYLYAAVGAARAHEDDARRALRAALALRGLFDAAPPGADSGAGATGCGASIGIASGTLRVGGYGGRTRQSFGAQGDAVNAAARLMMLAQPGEILASGRVRAAVASEFALQPRAPIPLKGKAEPMPVFALLGPLRARAARLQPQHFVLPMVGRDDALRTIERERDLAAAGRAEVMTAIGEAGIGKSRLLAEGIRLAQQRGFTGFGGSSSDNGVRAPYGAWRGVWSALLDLDPLQTPRQQARAVEAAVARLGTDHAEAWPLLGPVLGLDLPPNEFTRRLAPKDRKALLETLLVQGLRAVAQDAVDDANPGGGVLLLLEDLHQADPLSLDLIDRVGRDLAALPVLLMLSARPPEADGDADLARRFALATQAATDAPPAATGAAVPVTQVLLSALTAAQSEQLIRAKLAAQFPERANPVPAALIERIVERAQGNPLYIEMLLNHLLERGFDPQHAEAWQALDWPVGLRSLVLSKIDRLSMSQQLELKVASVIGRRFGLATLQACAPVAIERERLHADLRSLAHLGLAAEAAEAEDPTFVFRHRVTQEVAYDSLAHDSRVQLHARVAQYLEQCEADGQAGRAAALAHHWACAEQPDRAWPHLLRAGDEAAASFANEEALACFTQVLAWLPAAALDARIDTLLRRESIHDLLGRHEARRADLAALDELANQLAAGDGGADDAAARLRGRVALRRARVEFDVGNFAAAAHIARDALREPGPAAAGASASAIDPVHEIKALLLLARATFAAGQAQQARAPLERALELARRHGQARSASLALAQLGLVAWQAGRYDAAEALLHEALLHEALPGLRASGDLRRELDVLNNLGVVAKSRARFAQAVAYYEQAQAIARRIGDRSGEAMLFNNMASAALAANDFHRAALDSERAERIWTALQETGQLGAALTNRGEAHRELGQYAAAQAAGERALALLRASGAQRLQATVLENLGRVALALGDTEGARRALDEALALARDNGVRTIEASTLLDLARLHLRTGALDSADAALQQAAPLLAELGDPLGQLDLQAVQADLTLCDAAQPEPERARAALAALEGVLPRLLAPAATDSALPMPLYLTGWRVLLAAGDARAAALLARARSELSARAARIPDPAVRRDFLAVAEHRSLLAG